MLPVRKLVAHNIHNKEEPRPQLCNHGEMTCFTQVSETLHDLCIFTMFTDVANAILVSKDIKFYTSNDSQM